MSKERKNNPLYLDFVTFHCYRIADNDYQRVACFEKLALAGELTKSGMSYGRYPVTIRDGSANDICGDLGAALDVSVSPSRRLGFCCPDNSALLIGQQCSVVGATKMHLSRSDATCPHGQMASLLGRTLLCVPVKGPKRQGCPA